jgi:hypothetical protein
MKMTTTTGARIPINDTCTGGMQHTVCAPVINGCWTVFLDYNHAKPPKRGRSQHGWLTREAMLIGGSHDQWSLGPATTKYTSIRMQGTTVVSSKSNIVTFGNLGQFYLVVQKLPKVVCHDGKS